MPEPLAVRCEHNDYVIEPIRFALGLSRIEMVDDHLAALIQAGRSTSPDIDHLLDARARFAVEA